jgi:ketosteroid isomerase-like protein
LAVTTNVEIVVGQFDDVNARNFVAAMAAYAEDVTLVVYGLDTGDPELLEETVTGKAAVGEWFGDWFRQFGADYRIEVDESRGSGDHVFLVATHHGRGRTSGVPVKVQLAYVYEVRQGKIARLQMWTDREAALAGFPD